MRAEIIGMSGWDLSVATERDPPFEHAPLEGKAPSDPKQSGCQGLALSVVTEHDHPFERVPMEGEAPSEPDTNI